MRLFLLLPLMVVPILSCTSLSTYQEETLLPKNESIAQYMNPRGYAYPVVNRLIDGNP